VPLSAADKNLYSKLFVSRRDIALARYCASVILKKGWHGQEWERRGTVYQQQAVFTTALVTAYARPFTRSKGRKRWPDLPKDLVAAYSGPEKALHYRLIRLRHTVYAHSASASYSIRPWRSGDFSTDIVGQPVMRLALEEATLFQEMSGRLLKSISTKMEVLLAAAA
jgi:hypothetical protein